MTERAGGPPPRLDTLGMWEAAASLPQCLREGLRAGREVFGAHAWELGSGEPVRSVALFGLGVGGLAAEAAAAVSAPHLGLPCSVIAAGDTAGMPGFVGPDTLAFAVSCGDGTGTETADSLREALVRGSRGAVVAGEGALSHLAAESGSPRCAPATVGGPAGGVGAFGAAVVSLLVALAHVGLSTDVASSAEAAAEALARRHDTFAAPEGSAEVLARRVGRTIPIVYGGGPVSGTAARWWKARVNRNAKAPAFAAQLPGLVHDELAGWGQGGDVTRQVMSLVLLRHTGEDPAAGALFDAVVAAVDEVMADVVEVRAEGDDDLARFLDLVAWGDFVSLFSAAREGVDPGPVPVVEELGRGSA